MNFGDGGSGQRAVFAALDLGTNNCRLLMARRAPEGAREPLRVVESFSRITRLGEGLETDGALAQAAMERTLAALAICAERMARRRLADRRCIATAACRRASNGAAFLQRVAVETGLELEAISPEREARLAAIGCLPLLDPAAERAIVFDIGGGSTELAALRRDGRGGYVHVAEASLPRGVVTLAERHGGAEMSSDSYAAIVAETKDLLGDFRRRLGDAGEWALLGSSGTVTTLAAVHLDLPRYDRRRVDGSWMTPRQAATAIDGLVALGAPGRARHPCIDAGRADLVLAGSAILEAILAVFPVERFRVADRGLREGLLTEMMAAAPAAIRAA
ncbi:MAG: Ppx/GppA family phosphatase [Alphaproteobacteria bacterium]|nr:Ppx/GppA family phosphatase [Alphaproteobacteria bacterium]